MSEVPVVNIYDLSDVVNCLFHVLTAARLEDVLFLSTYQQSGIHCQMICRIQLLTLNIFGRTLDTSNYWTLWSNSALRVVFYAKCSNDRHLLTLLT